PMGDSALLLETDGIEAVLALAAVLTPLVERGAGVWEDVDELVPAARTLLVVARPTTDLADLAAALVEAARGADRARSVRGQRVVEIPVTYDGPDLEDVA